jgi:hypothetical protein
MPADLILCCEVDVVIYEQMTQEVQTWNQADSAHDAQLPPQGFSEPGFVHRWVVSLLHRGCAVYGLAARVSNLTAYYSYRRHQGGTWSRVLPVKLQWHQPVLDRMQAFLAAFPLHNNHAKVNRQPRKGLLNKLAECCAGDCRIIAGDTDMTCWGLIPEMADIGLELRMIPHNGEWNIAQDLWQWDYCGEMISGPMPKPGQCIDMTTISRYGMIRPFALDGRTENRGYIVASYSKAYQIPLNEEVIDEGFMREYGNWLRERMQIYSSGAALAAHMPDLIPEHAVHALIEFFADAVTNPENRTLVLRPWVPRSARQQHAL